MTDIAQALAAAGIEVKPLVWLESHGGLYTGTYAITERPEGGWVVSVRPIESPVFASAEEAKVWVMREVKE